MQFGEVVNLCQPFTGAEGLEPSRNLLGKGMFTCKFARDELER